MMFGMFVLDALILGSDVAMGGTFLAVFQKLRKTGSSAGLSLQTLVAILSARMLHLASHRIGLHYTPNVIPFTLFFLTDIVNLLAGLTCLFFLVNFYYSTYEVEKDNFGIQLFERFNLLPKSGPLRHKPEVAASFLYIVVAIAAFGWYYARPKFPSFAIGYFCCFFEAMSAVALVPQLWMFNKDKRVSPLLANFVVLIAVGRVCTLTFWSAYPLVFPWRVPQNRSIQMISESLNLLILSDFLFYWARSKIRGEKEIILGGDCFV